MPDPIRHDDLTNPGNLLAAYRLTCTIAHVLDDEPAIPGTVAAAAALIFACIESGVDPEAVLQQVQEAYERGDMQIPEEEAERIEAPFTIIH